MLEQVIKHFLAEGYMIQIEPTQMDDAIRMIFRDLHSSFIYSRGISWEIFDSDKPELLIDVLENEIEREKVIQNET